MESPCVAVVDDEGSIRTALRRLLRLADYDVATFESGEAFLASLPSRRPACVVLDVHMPGLSGIDVQVRLRVGCPSIPVVFMTASDDVALEAMVLAVGGIRLLRKPFSNDALLEAIGAATGMPKDPP